MHFSYSVINFYSCLVHIYIHMYMCTVAVFVCFALKSPLWSFSVNAADQLLICMFACLVFVFVKLHALV